MIITTGIAKQNLANYSNQNNKILRDIRDGKLFKIVNGLYETDINTPGYLLAGSIYGPSYISFEYALSYYGLIPERVTTITCATFNKKRKKCIIHNLGYLLIEMFQIWLIQKILFCMKKIIILIK